MVRRQNSERHDNGSNQKTDVSKNRWIIQPHPRPLEDYDFLLKLLQEPEF